MTRVTAEQIDALLPQTQCGQCGYGGCMPYAKAMEQGSAAINLCPPGGVATLSALAQVLHKTVSAEDREAMQQQETAPTLAYIRADECIGCTKCIQACPVDAIVGAAKQLHTILQQECTGCGLCVEPCPVDCIDLLPLSEKHYSPVKARKRYQARQWRLQKAAKTTAAPIAAPDTDLDKKKAYIQAAIARAKHKKKPL